MNGDGDVRTHELLVNNRPAVGISMSSATLADEDLLNRELQPFPSMSTVYLLKIEPGNQRVVSTVSIMPLTISMPSLASSCHQR